MMHIKNNKTIFEINHFFDSFWPIIFLGLIGLFIVIINFFKFDFSIIPGSLGDGRLNNYLLEHNYLWITNQIINFWNDSGFFYPFNDTLAFSSNHLGTGFIYSFYRLIGLSRESSYQAWLLTGFVANFVACAYTLMHFQLKPLAVGVGAFIFSFGLPIVPQLDHSQLLYRFGIPLAILYLFEFIKSPHLKSLTIFLGLVIWQFYAEIYIGYFLVFLLIAIIIIHAIRKSTKIIAAIQYWPRMISKAWNSTTTNQRIFYILTIGILLIMFIFLLIPYIRVSKNYGFTRSWDEIESMLPRIGSYFLAGHSLIWKFISTKIKITTMHPGEHQLFFGFIPLVLCTIALIWRQESPTKRELVYTIAGAGLAIFIVTIDINGFSFYKFFASLPGFSAIRAVTRVALVILFVIGLISAITVDTIILKYNYSFTSKVFLFLSIGFLIMEVSLINYPSIQKSVLQNRIVNLKAKLPPFASLPDDPVLFVASPSDEPFWAREVDVMLLAQELRWKTLNGYSGNLPPGYTIADNCRVVVKRIFGYLNFSKKNDESHYLKLIHHIVPIGFDDCESSWWKEAPQLKQTIGKDTLPISVLKAIYIQINSIKVSSDNRLLLKVTIHNQSDQSIPAHSATDNFIRLSWRFTDIFGKPLSEWNNRRNLDFDIPEHGKLSMNLRIDPPKDQGSYYIEFSVVQELVAWLHNLGMPVPRSTEHIEVLPGQQLKLITVTDENNSKDILK